MQIFEYTPTGSYKRIVTREQAQRLHSLSDSEMTFEEALEWHAKKPAGLLIFEGNGYDPKTGSFVEQAPIGVLYARKAV